MTPEEFTAEVRSRIGINEGRREMMYRDSLGIKTIGVGFNLERGDAMLVLAKIGVSNVDGVIAGYVPLSQPQIDALLEYTFEPIEAAARASLAPGVYDALSDARRFVLCDLEFNLGQRGWLGFATTRAILDEAQGAKSAGKMDIAHRLFGLAADHLAASAWDSQVGNRASRDVAMMRTSGWCAATGEVTTC